MIASLETSDLLEDVVPASRRDSSLRMSLVWITFQASVSNMYTGYLARADGLSFGDLLIACAIGTACMVGYGLLAANVGTQTGQAHSVLARGVLGRTGSGLASVLLIVTGMGWYGFQAVFLALLFNGLFGLTHLQLFCALFAMVMIVNNLLGFRSVAAYARYVAAPILVLWGLYAIIKSFATAAGPHLFAVPHVAQTQGILLTVELLIGVAMFGNEPDIFRYARRSRSRNALPLGLGYGFGMLVFPAAGYLMAELSNASTLGATMQVFIKFSLFGLSALGVLVFTINLFALNDANLYEAVNAVENLLRGRRRFEAVLGLGVVGAVVAVFIERSSSLKSNFFTVANICAVCLPCTTIVMALDVFLLERITGCRRRAGADGTPRALVSWADASIGNVAGIAAILAGVAVGAVTGGLIPGTAGFNHTNIGIPAVEAWGTAIGVYLAGLAVARLVSPAEAKRIILGLTRADHVPAAVDLTEDAPDETPVEVPADASVELGLS